MQTTPNTIQKNNKTIIKKGNKKTKKRRRSAETHSSRLQEIRKLPSSTRLPSQFSCSRCTTISSHVTVRGFHLFSLLRLIFVFHDFMWLFFYEAPTCHSHGMSLCQKRIRHAYNTYLTRF